MREGRQAAKRGAFMKLNLREIIEIPGSSVPFSCELETEGLDFPSIVRYETAPYAVGRVFNEAGVLRMEGEIKTELLCVCDRCAGEFKCTKTTPLSAVIVEKNEDNADDPELFFLDGDEIDLDEMLSTLFILDMDTNSSAGKTARGSAPAAERISISGLAAAGKN